MSACRNRQRVLSELLALVLLGGCAPSGGFRITPVPADQTLEERVIRSDSAWATDKIALIDLDGLLVNQTRGGFFSEGENPVSLLVEKLQAAEKDKGVKAVVLRINSPGGTVTASQLMHDEIQHFRERTKKPVVSMFMDLTASGGYFVACATDEMVACPTTVTGSIGVIMQMLEISDTLTRIGVTTDAIISGPHKDSGSPFRKMRPEERQLFQTIVDGMYEQFVSVVCAGRPLLTEARVKELADGRVYLAPQALKEGLIDRIGSLEDAVASAKKRANVTKVKIVRYERPLGYKPTWYASAPPAAPGATINMFNLDAGSLFTSGPSFLYLWRPGL